MSPFEYSYPQPKRLRPFLGAEALDFPLNRATPPPLAVVDLGEGPTVFEWIDDPATNPTLQNATLLLMAATASELYLDLFPLDDQIWLNKAWDLINGVIDNPSDPPKARQTPQGLELETFNQIRPENPYFSSALGSLADGAARMARQFSGNGSAMNEERGRRVSTNSILSAIRALALASNDINPFVPGSGWQRVGPGQFDEAKAVLEYWIQRWWDRVTRRLAFTNSFNATLSGH